MSGSFINLIKDCSPLGPNLPLKFPFNSTPLPRKAIPNPVLTNVS